MVGMIGTKACVSATFIKLRLMRRRMVMMVMHSVPISSAFHRSIPIPFLQVPFLLLGARSSIPITISESFIRSLSPISLPPFLRKHNQVISSAMHTLIISMVDALVMTIPTLQVLRVPLPYPSFFRFRWFRMTSLSMMIDGVRVAGRPRALCHDSEEGASVGAVSAHHGIHKGRLDTIAIGGVAPIDGLLIVLPSSVLGVRLADDTPPHPTGAGFMLPTTAPASHLNLPAGVGPHLLGPSSVSGCRWRRLTIRVILGRGAVGSASPQSPGGNPSSELLDALPGSPGPAQGVVLSTRHRRLSPSNRDRPHGVQGSTRHFTARVAARTALGAAAPI